VLEEVAGMGEGRVGKYLADARVKHLSVASLLQIAEAVGVRTILVTDETLLRRVRPMWESRDAAKAHARRRAPLGPVTLKRVLSPVAAEMGRRGAAACNSKIAPETRRALAQAAAQARWRNKG
jgi:hypothetical protein